MMNYWKPYENIRGKKGKKKKVDWHHWQCTAAQSSNLTKAWYKQGQLIIIVTHIVSLQHIFQQYHVVPYIVLYWTEGRNLEMKSIHHFLNYYYYYYYLFIYSFQIHCIYISVCDKLYYFNVRIATKPKSCTRKKYN